MHSGQYICFSGIMLLFGCVVQWLLPPTETICLVRHFLHPLAMALCFGVLLVKAMHLRLANFLALCKNSASLVRTLYSIWSLCINVLSPSLEP